MKSIKFGFLCGVVACAINAMQAQTIVNTETLMLDSEEAFQWTIGLGGDFSAGNSSVVDLTLDGGCAWALEAWEVKASGAWAQLSEDGNDIQSSAFGQIRIMRGDVNVAQPFVFAQTSQNNVLLLSQRSLIGAGVKRRVVKSETFFLDASLGVFAERETYTEESEELPKDLVRNSLILSFGWDVSETVSLRTTTFVQSSYKDVSDSRVFLECGLNVALSDQVAFEWSSGLRWDGQPHGGLGRWDLGNTVGLRLGLNDGD
jgi:putative salt-induced outer membrane protein YdiY